MLRISKDRVARGEQFFPQALPNDALSGTLNVSQAIKSVKVGNGYSTSLKARMPGEDPLTNNSVDNDHLNKIETPSIEAAHHSDKISLFGRIGDIKKIGRTYFSSISDHTGKLEIVFPQDEGKRFRASAHKGDIVKLTGRVKQNERSLNSVLFQVDKYCPLKKCLIEPDLAIDTTKKRYNNRFVDFTLTARSSALLALNSCFNEATRKFLWDQSFSEFNTPILSTRYNGGSSTPFETAIKASKKLAYLRVSSESYLKQIVSSGYPAVFELSSQFRNEGSNSEYMQEFTLLEMFKIGLGAREMTQVVIDLIKHLFLEAQERNIIESIPDIPDKIANCKVISAHQAIHDEFGIDILSPVDQIISDSNRVGFNTRSDSSLATAVGNLVSKVKRNHSEGFVIVTDLPFGMTPLMKHKDDNSAFADRYWIYLNGVDIADIGSSQEDYNTQKSMLEHQHHTVADGKRQDINVDLVNVAAYGLLPLAEAGISMTRLMKSLVNADHIKETSLFPL